jgi:predicted phosphodiesterase
MSIAIVADIHANAEAIKQVLKDAYEQQAHSLWFLGDMVGYGAQPYKAWAIVYNERRVPCRWALAGNHDWGLLKKLGDTIGLEAQEGTQNSQFNQIAWRALQKNRQALEGQKDIYDWLSEQPLVVSPRAGIYLAHGTFDMDDMKRCLLHYIQKDEDAEKSWQSLQQWQAGSPQATSAMYASSEGWHPPQLLVIGHWHRQLAWQRQAEPAGQDRWKQLRPDFGANPNIEPAYQPQSSRPIADLQSNPLPYEVLIPVSLQGEDTTQPVIINPGSVGLPRDGAKAANGWTWAKYALLEWTPPNILLRFRHVPYKNETAIQALQTYPSRLAEWLKE